MRNCFVSYAHRLDGDDAAEFRSMFANQNMVFSDKSLKNQDLSLYSDDYIKNNFIRPKIRNSSVTIVLIGKETGGRWWVDWEIYYSLIHTIGNDRNGLLGIYLPCKQHFMPKRLEKNQHMAHITTMPKDIFALSAAIELAYNKRNLQPDLSDPLRQRNSYIYQ